MKSVLRNLMVIGGVAGLWSCGAAVLSERQVPNQGSSNTIPTYTPQPSNSIFPTPIPVVPASPLFSNGSGGRLGAFEQTFTASNGKSSKYKTSIPTDLGPNNAYGVNVHLHGDNGGDYTWLYKDNVRIAATHKLIGIVIYAPNSQKVWYDGGEKNALFLHEFMQNEILKKYNIDKRRIFFSGVSGGSQFLTGQFIPLYGNSYRGGATMLCGGPDNWLRQWNPTEEFRQNFKFTWYTTSGDFLVDQVRDGIAYYKNKGMNVQSEILSGGKHCDFPGGIAGALEKQLNLIAN